FPTRRSSDLLAAKGLGAKEWNNSLKTKLSLLPKKLFRIRMSRVRTSVFPARTRKVNANNSAALTGRSTPLIMFSVNSAPSMMRRSEERFSRNAETDLVCRLLLEKKNTDYRNFSKPKQNYHGYTTITI